MDEGPESGRGQEPGGPIDVEGNSGAGSNATELIAGWPAPPARTDDTGGAAGGWPRTAGASWPGQSVAASGASPADGESEEGNDAFWHPDAGTAVSAASTPRDTSPAVDRANQLVDELRGVIATLGAASNQDLTGVISDLEVAVNPPGALGTDERAELREALLRARERPRDLDTAIELSNRVDGVVALMFAYDRAIAAIERSLAVLRREPAVSSASAASGDTIAAADFTPSAEE